MSASFLTSLDVRIMDDCGPRPRMMLLEPLHFQCESLGTLVIPRFFVFDGASVPTPAMGVVGWPAVRAACAHDYALSIGVERRTAAHAFREGLEACGVDEGTAELLYQAVRVYDRYVEKPQEDPPVGA